MKICWDNLERLRYSHKSKKWYNRNTAYIYKESCLVCGEPFLAQYRKGTDPQFCDGSCRAKYSHKVGILDSKMENHPNWKGGIKVNDPKAYYRRWQRNHPEQSAHRCSLRRARLNNNPTPSGYSKERILILYKIRDGLNFAAGRIAFHVDHKVPICVGGPHHQDNLRVLPAVRNLKRKRSNVNY